MYVSRSTNEMLTQALKKLSTTSDITAVSPGSIARTIAELVAVEIGDFQNILEFNMAQSVMSTAGGRALDMWGELFAIPRKRLSSIATDDAIVGAFYFYLDAPEASDVTIPAGTRTYTGDTSALGAQSVYATVEAVTIKAGRTRVYASVAPLFADSIFTAGPNTLVNHNAVVPGITVRCTNPKAIAPVIGLESDNDYRARLMQQIRTATGGTEMAIKFAVLAVPGIRDVKVRDAPYGLGSFEVLVNAEDYSMSAAMVATAAQVVAAIRPVGCRAYVRAPDLLPFDISVTITKRQGIAFENESTHFRAKNAILRYLNRLTIGQPLIYNELIASLYEASEAVLDVTFTRLAANGSEVLRKNYVPHADEHIIPGEVQVDVG